MNNSHTDSAEREAPATTLPSPFDELAALPSQSEVTSLATLDGVQAFVQAVRYFAGHYEQSVWMWGQRQELMEQFRQRRDSVAAWASALAAAVPENAKLYERICTILREPWERVPVEWADRYAHRIRGLANQVLALAARTARVMVPVGATALRPRRAHWSGGDMASRKRLSVWGILARLGDRDHVCQGVFESASHVTTWPECSSQPAVGTRRITPAGTVRVVLRMPA